MRSVLVIDGSSDPVIWPGGGNRTVENADTVIAVHPHTGPTIVKDRHGDGPALVRASMCYHRSHVDKVDDSRHGTAILGGDE